MMKKNVFILLLAGLLCSCNSWFDIEPENQIGKNKLFGDEAGYQNALNGIYQMCAEPAMYGKNMSWGALSVMSQVYDNTTIGTADKDLSTYNYKTPTSSSTIEKIWKGLYNAIANCNLLLNHVSTVSPSMFTSDTIARNVIMGEALALRAFCHFDVIRLFAPAPILNDQRALIPYQDRWPSELTKPLAVNEAIDKVIVDLLKAKDLLAFHDTLHNTASMKKFASRFEGTSGGKFFNYRGYRLNYCAVVGMLARVYRYKGDTDRALACASELYYKFVREKKWFIFNKASDFTANESSKQKKHLEDCLFAFYNAKLITIYSDDTQGNLMHLSGVDEIFKNDKDDYRLYLIGKEDGQYTSSIKYRSVDNTKRDNVEGRAIPILRMSEIYHILIECLYEKGDESKALAILKELRNARGCKNLISSILDSDNLYEILINDARKEFIGEGQLFFYYKRLNRGVKMPGTEIEPNNEMFTFNVPDSQNIF